MRLKECTRVATFDSKHVKKVEGLASSGSLGTKKNFSGAVNRLALSQRTVLYPTATIFCPEAR
jgi:hypothetical protein